MGDGIIEALRALYKDIDGRSGMDMGQYDAEIQAEMLAKWWGILFNLAHPGDPPVTMPHPEPMKLLAQVRGW